MNPHINSLEKPFVGLDRTLGNFCAWAFADLMSNTTRGMIAEYLVRCSLGQDGSPAPEWDFEAIKYRHQQIADAKLFHSGIGLRLQNLDSRMAMRVQLELSRDGIAAVPIHDSHVVQTRHGDKLNAAMRAALDQTVDALKKVS